MGKLHNNRIFLLLTLAALLLGACNMPDLTTRPTPVPSATPVREEPTEVTVSPTKVMDDELDPSPTAVASLVPSATPVPTEEPLLVTATMNANCRRGPSKGADQYAYLLLGESALAQGWNDNPAYPWFLIDVDDKPDPCWISGSTLEYSFDPSILPYVAPPLGSIAGEVWHDICEHTGGQGGEPLVLGLGCAEGLGPNEMRANGVHDGFEDGFAGVTIHLGSGACPSTGLATTVTDVNGQYAFTGLTAGTYCVSFNALTDGNDSILIPGGLTSPTVGGTPRVTVTLLISQNMTGVAFGWMWQFGN
jgi:hypothetical protein